MDWKEIKEYLIGTGIVLFIMTVSVFWLVFSINVLKFFGVWT